MAKKILLCGCGKGPYSECDYYIENETNCVRAEYCFVGIAKLLGLDSIYLLLTPEAKSNNPEAKIKNLLGDGIGLKSIDIKTPKNITEVWLQFDDILKVFEDIDEELEIYLDITFAFRHLPIIFYASAMYLETSNSNISLKGIFYGANEAGLVDKSESGVKKVPIFNITNIANIVRGSFAVREFEKTGHISGLKNYMNDILSVMTRREEVFIGKGGKINKVTKADQLGSKNKDEFTLLENYILNGLPFESGIAANNLLENLNTYKSGIKAVDMLLSRLIGKISSFSIKNLLFDANNGIAINKSSRIFDLKYKKYVELTISELKRQLSFIDLHINFGDISNSLVLLREWLVSRVILANMDNHKNWIDHGMIRQNAENLLNYHGKFYKNYDGKPIKSLLEKWFHDADIRNKYAHAGYRNDVVEPNNDINNLKELFEFCAKYVDNDEYWKLPIEENDNAVALITPMGASVGLLFTALRKVTTDKVVVLTSEKFKGKVSEVCAKAGFDADKVKVFAMQDVFCGFGEAKQLSSDMISAVKGTCNCIVNLTGGTTAMQWTMQTVYEELKQKNKSVKRIAFVDRRPSVEQQNNPYVEGELIDVESLI